VVPGAVPRAVVLVACIAWDPEPEAAAVLGSLASGASGSGALAWFQRVGAMVGRSEAEEFTGRTAGVV